MLKSDRIKLVVETSGAIAVLLGLVFVGLELRQNTYAVEAATFQSLTDASNDFIMTIASDAELSRIYTSGLADVSSLNSDEYQRFYMTIRSFWVRMQNVYSQWQRGTLSDDDWRLYQAVLCIGRTDESGESGVEATFDEHRMILSEEFQQFVDTCWAQNGDGR
jgi:hypothetical protein